MLNEKVRKDRQSPADLCITFEVNGEQYTICIGAAELTEGDSRDELKRALGDYISCSLCCARKRGFAACMLRCVEGDGRCCDNGANNCE
ncbi:hypothetical protein [Sphingomonas sp.]|jgi:hypothetical protein|uniref:hypothetical protein n=1 Tax=Sphingomonas sp. TaxID=28214 RepID=UPI0017F95FC5|nr:hypothetical protein [Sphingomonas sp.]MBA3511292.1 hypothetical protein [Sphingomonas sp.]